MCDAEGRNLFLVSVCDLAIECRDYDLIFGRMQVNGMRSRGLLDQFESVQVEVRQACAMVAQELVRRGMFDDAIKMFDLAGNREQSLHYTSILLSQVVHQPNKQGTTRERVQVLAKELFDRYSSDDVQCDAKIVATFTLLCELMLFFDFYHERKFQLALETLNEIKLVPFASSDLDGCNQRFKE